MQVDELSVHLIDIYINIHKYILLIVSSTECIFNVITALNAECIFVIITAPSAECISVVTTAPSAECIF